MPQEELLLNMDHAHPGVNLQGASLNAPQEGAKKPKLRPQMPKGQNEGNWPPGGGSQQNLWV